MNVQDLAYQLGELVGEGKGTWPVYLRLVNDADPVEDPRRRIEESWDGGVTWACD